MAEHIHFADPATPPRPTTGSAGLHTRVHGGQATVSLVAATTGGIGRGHLIVPDTK